MCCIKAQYTVSTIYNADIKWPLHNITNMALLHVPVSSPGSDLGDPLGSVESFAALSKFTARSESPFGWSAAQKLLKQLTLPLPEASHWSDLYVRIM
jgi:hypothetical protein